MKKAQVAMVWFLPLIVIGGFFYPMLGYLVLLAILFMLILSIFKARFWWMGLFVFRLITAGESIKAIGLIFVIMCLISTIIATILGIITKHRAWCMICPMGLLQEKIGKIKHD